MVWVRHWRGPEKRVVEEVWRRTLIVSKGWPTGEVLVFCYNHGDILEDVCKKERIVFGALKLKSRVEEWI